MDATTELPGTTELVPSPPYLEKYWLVCESLLVILTFLVVYLTTRLAQHAIEKKAKRGGKDICQKILLKWLCVFSSATLLLRLCSDHLAAFYGWRSDESCFATVTGSTVLLTLSLYSVYIFLWVRQSIFYTNPIMKRIIRPAFTYISWFILVFMILTGIAMGVMYNMTEVTKWVYKATADGCKEVSENSPETITGLAVAFTIFFQLALLGLFVYPLHSRKMDKFRTNGTGTPSNSSVSRSDDGKKHQLKESSNTAVESSSQRNPKYKTTQVISPLARNDETAHFTFPNAHNQISVEADNESGAEQARGEWPLNTTIKRDQPSSPPPDYFYQGKRVAGKHQDIAESRRLRAKTHSVSSENTVSPVVSDSEASTSRLTLRRKSKKEKHDEKKDKKEGGKLLVLMKHYTYLMVVCIITDAIAASIQSFFVLPELIYLVIYDINLLINLMCIVVTYPEWRKILIPCVPKVKQATRTFAARKIRRTPTPPRKRGRVQELKLEGKRGWRSPSRRSSGSGYESGDSNSHGHIYKPGAEARELIKSRR